MRQSEKDIHRLQDSISKVNTPFKTISDAIKGVDTDCNFKKILDIIQDGIWITNSNDVICCCNKAMSKIAGIPSEDIIGKNILTGFSKETIENLVTFYKKAKKSKKPQWYDISLITPSNKKTWQNGWLVPQYENGHYFGMLCTVHDNSDENISKLKLANSEEQYRNLMESLSMGVGYFDLDGNVLFFNKIAAKNMGGKPKEFVGKSLFELYGSKNGKIYHDRIIEASKSETSIEYIDKVELPTGIFWFKSLYNKILDDSGKISGIQIISSDISKSKGNEAKLIQLNDTLKAAQEMAKVGYWSFDIKTQQPTWSDQMFVICGYKKEEGVPKYEDHKLTWHPDDWDMFDNAVKECEQGKAYNIVIRIWFPEDNTYHYINTQGFPKYSEDGKIETLFGTSQDISMIKEAEKKILRNEIKYKNLINKMMNAFALHEIIYNEKNEAIDYRFIEVNPAWEKIVGLKAENVIGKTIKSIMPDIENSRIKLYERIVKSGIPEEFDDYNQGTQKHYHVYAYSPEKDKFAVFLNDVTEREKNLQKITESEERFELAMKASQDGLYDWNLINNDIYYSPGWKKMLGYKYNELPNEFSIWEKLTKPEDIKKSWNMLEKVKNKEIDRFEIEFKMKHKNGHWVDILSRANAIFDKNGTAVRMIGTHVDISERKQAEARIRESEEKYRIFYNNSPMAYQSLTIEGNILDVNPTWLEELGYTKEDVIGKNFGSLLHPSWQEHFKINFPKFKEKGYIHGVHFKIKHKNGHYKDILFEGKIGKNIDGSFKQTHCVFQDITEKKQAEEKIIKLSTAVEQSPSIILITDLSGNIEYVNPKFTELTGYTQEEALGKKPRILKSGELEETTYKELWEAISSGKEWHGEFHNRTKDGVLFWEAASISPILNDAGDITHYLKVAENITKRKEVEHNLTLALEKAKESDKLKSAFLANMSHEIRTPMNGILGFSSLLKQANLNSEKQHQYIDIIEQSGKRMLNTINDLIDIARIEANQVKIENKSFNFNKLLDNLYLFFKREAEEKGLEFSLDLNLLESNAILDTDEDKFYSIIANFVKNAIKYTDTGKIILGYKIEKNAILFYVEDTGIGIDSDRHKAIFERFIQADLSITKPYEGSGLGLAISKAYADMIGGKILLKSKFGKGSTFYLQLPFNSLNKTLVTDINTPSNNEKDYHIHDLNVLIVEDDPTSILYLELLLKPYCQNIFVASTGHEALDLFDENFQVDLILMDVKMPDMDGYEVTKRIRKFDKNTPIIAQTAFAMESDKTKAIEVGCNDYISKPIHKNKLLELISKYVELN